MAVRTEFEERRERGQREIRSTLEQNRGGGAPTQSNGSIAALFAEELRRSCDADQIGQRADIAAALLSVAYNTTPQIHGEIRSRLSASMEGLARAIETGEKPAFEALRSVTSTLRLIDRSLSDWTDVKASKDPGEVQSYMSQDLIVIARQICTRALQHRDAFLAVQKACAETSADLAPSLSNSIAAFGLRLSAGAPIDGVLEASAARRARFDSLVAGLSSAVSAVSAEIPARASSSADVIVGLVAPAARTGGAATPALAPSLFHDRAPEPQARADPADRERLERILDGVESFERARLDEATADAEVLGLMALGSDEGEMLRLSVWSLDRGLDAIRRLGASFEEAASVFKSLADAAAAIQQEMAGQAGARTEGVDRSIERVDEIFVRQVAQWTAVKSLSEAIQKSCAASRADIASLAGAHITHDKLKTYIASASDRVRHSVAEREADARARLSQVDLCRARLREA